MPENHSVSSEDIPHDASDEGSNHASDDSSDHASEGSNHASDDVSVDTSEGSNHALDDSSDHASNHTSEDSLESKANVKPLTLQSLSEFKDKQDQTGVCYLSRLPPFMKPQKLRHLLSMHGAIGKLYCAPEDPSSAKKRKKYKGNKRLNYTEAWVEFLDKKQARLAATFLNSRNIGGKKKSRFYDDIWCIKYLPRFKWHHLTDQISYERASRDQKIRAEMAQVKRENKVFLKNVEKAKMIQAMEQKNQNKQLEKTREISRNFKQRKVKEAAVEQGKSSILSRVF